MLNREDYEEHHCPLEHPCACGKHGCDHTVSSVPLQRILAEYDSMANSGHIEDAETLLTHWRETAKEAGDSRNELSLLSELMGFYRMLGKREKGLAAVEDGLALMSKLGIADGISCGTILINAATTLQSFGETARSIGYYQEASRCYARHLAPDDWRFAGLLNNMASAYLETGDAPQAEAYYRKALSILETNGNHVDAAVTWVNLAQLYDQSNPEDDRIRECLDKAMEYFRSPDTPHDGYFAHSCLKCTSAFGYFGLFREELELKQMAGDVYARTETR